jgi:hypothetical protein
MSALYKLAYPKTSASFVHLNTPDLVTLSDGLKSSTSGLGSASVASGITLPMALTPPLGGTGRKKGSYIANLHPDPALTNIIDGTTKIKDLMGDSAPPLLDNGLQVCLSFLVRQGCWSTCKRAHIVAYLTAQQRKLTAARSVALVIQRLRTAGVSHYLDNLAGHHWFGNPMTPSLFYVG